MIEKPVCHGKKSAAEPLFRTCKQCGIAHQQKIPMYQLSPTIADRLTADGGVDAVTTHTPRVQFDHMHQSKSRTFEVLPDFHGQTLPLAYLDKRDFHPNYRQFREGLRCAFQNFIFGAFNIKIQIVRVFNIDIGQCFIQTDNIDLLRLFHVKKLTFVKSFADSGNRRHDR